MEPRCPLCGCTLPPKTQRCPNCGSNPMSVHPPSGKGAGLLALVAIVLFVSVLVGGFAIAYYLLPSATGQEPTTLPIESVVNSSKPSSSATSSSTPVSKEENKQITPLINTKYYMEGQGWDSNDYRPNVIFQSDGTFIFSENLYDGMGHFSGTYSQEGTTLTLTVQEVDFSGFTCAEVKTITFTLQDQTKLQLNTDLCMSRETPYFAAQ